MLIPRSRIGASRAGASRAATFGAGLLALAILATPQFAEARRLDPLLESMLPAVADGDTLEVIVSFHGDGPVSNAQQARLEALGLTGLGLRSLPIVGTVATPTQVQSLLAMDEVRSVWLNAPLDLENREATALTGVDRLRTDDNLRVNGMPVTGRGLSVLVNDSGVDGTHLDLKYPEHTRQNVAAQTNLYALSSILPITYTENVANTDIGGGHGTHVAGTIGGNGAASPGGAQEGVAPGAGIIGYGSGAGLFILDTLGGFDYALTHQAQYNIRVVSNSFGSTSDTGSDFDPDHPTNIATKRLADRGVVVVFSAGNSGSGEGTITGNFKKAPWVVTVAAGDKQGNLASFSSRGRRDVGGEVEIGGKTYTWEDRPTVTAPGVDIVSARASLGVLDKTSAEMDVEVLGPGQAAYYTHMSGTSMAAPHISGVVALMLEANPSLGWREVKQLLQETANNIPGRADWEAGAGYVNAYAAVQAAFDAGSFGGTVNAAQDFNADAQVSVAGSESHSINFDPVLEPDVRYFEVGSDIALVSASANVGDNTVAIVLTDPNGGRYGSSIALPVIGQNIGVSASGVAGTWSVTVRGVGSVSGVALDPLQVTNGYGVPGTVKVDVNQLRTDGFTGLADVPGHPAQGFIEFGVSNRLVDGLANGKFQPDRALTRAELAQYLVMGSGLRQWLPLHDASSFGDIGPMHPAWAWAESAAARGAPQRDLSHLHAGAMGKVNGAFRPDDKVSRVSLAYSLVQALGLQAEAQKPVEQLTVIHGNDRIAIEDAGSIPSSLHGYVQLALDQGLINARFELKQGPFDLQPTLVAWFDPTQSVTRAAYAVAASRYQASYRSAVD